MDKRLERILPRVQKPARYVGGEYNAIIKDKAAVDTRIAFCFPDTYEIGMSNLGMRILYGVMNQYGRRLVRARLRSLGRHGGGDASGGHAPLRAWNPATPSPSLTLWPSPLGYEMAFTAVLNMLDLAGHPPAHAADRTGLTPAGHCRRHLPCTTPSPWPTSSIWSAWARARTSPWSWWSSTARARREGWNKADFLRAAARLDGIYVPSPLRCDLSRRRHRGIHHAP